MQFRTLATALLAASSSLVSAALELPAGVPRSVEEFREKHPYRSDRFHGKCRKVVKIRSSCNETDDISAEFLEGIKKANHGGTLYLPKDELFVINEPLDLTFLNDIHVRLDGEIRFTDDTPHWQAVTFKHPFQHNLLFWKWGGKDIKIYGDGVLNGQGQRWWNEFREHGLPADNNYTYARPILFYAENTTNLHIEGIHYKDAPIWQNLIETTTGIYFGDILSTAVSNNASVEPKNTDFFDSLNIADMTVERIWVDIGDDCFSPKSNATNLHVNGMYCNNTHGQSIGSLGQYQDDYVYVEDVVIENVWLLNGADSSRIKVWAGPTAGTGYVNNITYRNIWSGHAEHVAAVDSCYFNLDEETCKNNPSKIKISNILYENFTGYTSGETGRVILRLTCSTNPDAMCENIKIKNWNVTSPCGPAVGICQGIDGGIGDEIPCYAPDSPEASAALKDTCTAPPATRTGTPW